MIIDMSDTVPRQHLKVVEIEEGGVTNLNRIQKLAGELKEKLIEPSAELVY